MTIMCQNEKKESDRYVFRYRYLSDMFHGHLIIPPPLSFLVDQNPYVVLYTMRLSGLGKDLTGTMLVVWDPIGLYLFNSVICNERFAHQMHASCIFIFYSAWDSQSIMSNIFITKCCSANMSEVYTN